MIFSRPWWAVAGAWACLTLSACSVSLSSLEGRACNDAHPCPDDLICSFHRCEAPDANPQIRDAGGPRWRQAYEGFAQTEAAPACTAQVEAFDGHRFTLRIAGGPPNDRAVARVARSHLPTSENGHLRGIVRLGSEALPQQTEFTVLMLQAGSAQTLVELYLVPKHPALGIRSTAGVLSRDSIWQGYAAENFSGVSSLFVPGRDNQIELKWKKGGTLQLILNRQELARWTLSSTLAAGVALPTSLEFGVPLCPECPSGPDKAWGITFEDWVYSGDPDADLDL